MLYHLACIESGGKAGIANKRTASVRLTDSAVRSDGAFRSRRMVMPNT
jgi:hypothetical protein